MIGLDTSHAPEFAKLINGDSHPEFPAKVTVAFPGGSEDIPSSRDRVAGFTKQLSEMGVTIVDSIEVLASQCDAVLLESVDGRPHLHQATPIIQAKLPLFIDKPLAGSLADAIAIDELAKQHKVKWFSSSSLRFSPSIIKYRRDPNWLGKVVGAFSWGPCPFEPTHPDLFWYGVHGVETLYTVMGPGCISVTRSYTEQTDVVTGIWSDGRVASFRGIRQGKSGYGVAVFGEQAIELDGKYEGYAPLVDEILQFFHDGTLPVEPSETIEMFAFMEAAQLSRERGGAPVLLQEAMERAKGKIP